MFTRTHRTIASLLHLTLLLGVCLLPGSSAAVPHRWTPTVGSPFGINIHTAIWNGDAKAIAAIKDAGIGWIRVDFNWFFMEPTKGKYNWQVSDGIVNYALQHNFNVFATLAYAPKWAQAYTPPQGKQSGPKSAQDWATFVEAVVKRYRGKISHWGIWNEPNLDHFLWFPDTINRADRLKFYLNSILVPGIQAVKRADPDAIAVAPDLAHLGQSMLPSKTHSWQPWMETILKQAGAQLDIIAHHTYQDDYMRTLNGTVWPWEHPSLWSTLQSTSMAKKPVWLTEIGWHTADVSEAQQASEYKKMLDQMLLLTQKKGGLWWQRVFPYELIDDPNIKEKWGMVRADWTRKPAWTAYKDYIKAHQPVARIQGPTTAVTGQAVSFDGSSSTDPDGSLVKYSWDFDAANGMQENAVGKSTSHTFTKPGTYEVTLTVTDDTEIAIGTRVKITVTKGSTPPKRATYDVAHAPSSIQVDGNLADWQGQTWIKLSGSEYDKLTEDWGGSSDLQAEAAFLWSPKGLYFAARVTDQSHNNTHSSGTLWQGDSIQLAIDADNDRQGPPFDTDGDYQFGFALAKGTSAWERDTAPTGAPSAKPTVVVQRSGQQTLYEVFLPAAGLAPLQMATGRKFSVSFLVNDDDGKGRKGWMQWSPGIARSKDPSQYPEATLLAPPTTEPPPARESASGPEPGPEPLPPQDASMSNDTTPTQEPPNEQLPFEATDTPDTPTSQPDSPASPEESAPKADDAELRPGGCGCQTHGGPSLLWLVLLLWFLGYRKQRRSHSS